MTGSHRFKLFTLDEAQAMIPQLTSLLTTIQRERQQLEEHVDALQNMTPAMKGNGHAAEAQERETHVQKLAESIRSIMQELNQMGIEVKDLEAGIVDFPSLREGRVVYLCWHLGEETIRYWHEVDSGFAGRRLLDDE